MFTGIVQGMGEVISFENGSLCVELPHLSDIEQGASIAIDGVCLTVTGFTEERIWFDVVEETLNLTTLAYLSAGDTVNFERAAKVGDEIGGHEMSGHVSCTATIESHEDGLMRFSLASKWLKYVTAKGFIAVDGCSLTVVEPDSTGFSVALIPETLSRTRFGSKAPGDEVNIEIDAKTQAIVDTVERMMQAGD
ncbi:MAG: riboflavin synthase subunit alpha [Candidatus Poseidoniaceae archaeon]|nr:riboflavin synthase subunit alpha [Candidatus Poseidoniaceae archaeon]MDP7202866.1 riboflavin synthase subunit alpha [Candidatus Poseidoniaceae archaeon]